MNIVYDLQTQKFVFTYFDPKSGKTLKKTARELNEKETLAMLEQACYKMKHIREKIGELFEVGPASIAELRLKDQQDNKWKRGICYVLGHNAKQFMGSESTCTRCKSILRKEI